MAYNEKLADRVRELITLTHKKVEEKKMFGGLSFMVNDKMCVGVKEKRMLVRIDPEMTDEVAEKEGCAPMVHSGKTMKGFIFVDIDTLQTKKNLEYWIKLALEYNSIARRAPQAKTSKKNNL